MPTMEPAAVWSTLAAERVALADLLDAADPSVFAKPSKCGGWRVHDVLAHLVVLAEAKGRFRFLAQGMRIDPRPNASVDKMARRLAATASPRELTERLRAARDGHFTVPGMPPVVALGEVLVHRADIAEAAALPIRATDNVTRAVLEAELRLWFAFGVSRSMRKRHFVPTDANWTVGPEDGPVVEAPGEELLLTVTGRHLPV